MIGLIGGVEVNMNDEDARKENCSCIALVHVQITLSQSVPLFLESRTPEA